jgi:transposase InsO family protein
LNIQVIFSFANPLKKISRRQTRGYSERIKRKIYKTMSEARAEIFNYIELFYNPSRRHGNNDGVSLIEFEKQYCQKLLSL